MNMEELETQGRDCLNLCVIELGYHNHPGCFLKLLEYLRSIVFIAKMITLFEAILVGHFSINE